jgi:hypothetical protein
MLPIANKLPMPAQKLSGAGIIAIIISAIAYSADTLFPGYTALHPFLARD